MTKLNMGETMTLIGWATINYAMGTFTQEFEYVAGGGDLNECNGCTRMTPEVPTAIYHDDAIDTFCNLQCGVKGKL